MKLTKAQLSLLRDVNREDRMGVFDTYSPAKRLVDLGLCTWETGRYGSMLITVTDAGRKALEDKL